MTSEPTDPYAPPASPAEPSARGTGQRGGHPCPSCGSRNTGLGVLTRRQADLFYLLFFGWLYLIKVAFSRRTDTCRDCGEAFSYKSTGSWVALGILLILLAGFLIQFLTGDISD